MRFVTWLLTNACALAVAALLFDGIAFDGPAQPLGEEVQEKLLPLLAVALILGVVTSVVKPVLTVLSIPFIIVTLGLFLLVINAAMLKFTGWLAEQLDLGFSVEGFWTCVGGAIVITLTTWVVDGVIGQEKERPR